MSSNEEEKPFGCGAPGCALTFANEDHLSVHRKKHQLCLTLPIAANGGNSLVDQTPTPSRFIGHFLKSYEESGLDFEAIHNITPVKTVTVTGAETGSNPFADTFRRASLQAGFKSVIPEPLGNGSTDESLNTPSIQMHASSDDHVDHVLSSIKASAQRSPCHVPGEGGGAGVLSKDGASLQSREPTGAKSRGPLNGVLVTPSLKGSGQQTSLAVPVICSTSFSGHLLHTSSGSRANSHPQGVTTTIIKCAPSSVVKALNASNGIKKSSPQIAAQTPKATKRVAVLPKPQPPLPVVATGSVYQFVLKLPDGNSVQFPAVQTATATTSLPAISSVSGVKPQTAGPIKLTTKLVQNSASTAVTITKNASHAEHAMDALIMDSSSPSTSSINADYEEASSCSLPRGKPGRRSKFAPEEDPHQKKMRSLERNRAAAMRCRKKRKMWVHALEGKAQELENQKEILENEVSNLRREVTLLKTALLAHKDCPVTLQQLKVAGQAPDGLRGDKVPLNGEQTLLEAIITPKGSAERTADKET